MTTVKRDPASQCQGKKRFASDAEARRHLFEGDGVYRCPHCQQWHISGSVLRPTRPAIHRTQQLYAGFDDGPEAA